MIHATITIDPHTKSYPQEELTEIARAIADAVAEVQLDLGRTGGDVRVTLEVVK